MTARKDLRISSLHVNGSQFYSPCFHFGIHHPFRQDHDHIIGEFQFHQMYNNFGKSLLSILDPGVKETKLLTPKCKLLIVYVGLADSQSGSMDSHPGLITLHP
ncbi:hypothetical protein C8R48DRAFT_346787 [Suillus tomentosus]|nr:hypothetical protein C8R48DRAFT_346787 [Suillus tomentosus]